MKITVTEGAGHLIATPGEARLDAVVATAFKDRMREIIHQADGLVRLDLSHVSFMDSSGLGAVIALLKATPVGKRLELTGLTPNVERVFRLTRMDQVFQIVPPLEPQGAEGAVI